MDDWGGGGGTRERIETLWSVTVTILQRIDRTRNNPQLFCQYATQQQQR